MAISVKILGSNAASFAHNRHHTSQLVLVQNKYVMIDCGEGTQLQCKKYNVKISRIDHIVISHLHGDHYYGLMGLISTMHLYGREKPLTLAGPPGLKEIISVQLRYSETRLNFPIEFTEWIPGERQQVLDMPKFSITTIPLDHRVPCSGYLIQEKPNLRRINRDSIPHQLPPDQIYTLKGGEDVYDEGGQLLYKNEEVTKPPLPHLNYAYCSDTRYLPKLNEILQDVDLLYHEATFMEDMKDRAENTYHTTARQAAQTAINIKARRLLIGHFSTRYKDLREVLEDAKTVFEHTELAIEGQTYDA